MAETGSQISGTKALRPKARILRTLGDELISSETVAVLELVKNAYDADATRVMVRFHEPFFKPGEGKIEVIDNGHGMTLQTIQTDWMEPATLYKKQQPRSKQRGRRVLGEKGVGRFAASKLANDLEVVTRHAGMDREVRALFDWTQFDDEDKYLDQIEALWEEGTPTEICPGGTIQELWRDDEIPQLSELNHGTILRMERLRGGWTINLFKELRTGLSRLVSPFFGEDEASQSDDFQIFLELPDEFTELSGIVRPPEALRNPHYTLTGRVRSDGSYDFTLKLRDQEKSEPLAGQFNLPDNHLPQCGPFSVEFRVWDRDQTSMIELARQYGPTTRDVRGDLDEAAGINIYRDGFRVLPYGEPRNDWLRLDHRRVQNPTLRLSNNQIVGYVLISADENPQLRDQSNREGLIEGPALEDLRESVKMALARLEERRYDIRHPKATQPLDQVKFRSGGLFVDFDLADVRNLISQQHPGDARLLALVEEKEQDLGRRVEEVQEILSRYRRLATLGQLIDTILHEGRAPLGKIINETLIGRRDIERAGQEQDGLVLKLSQCFSTIKTQADALATVFRKIEPFGGRKRAKPAQMRLEQVISDAFAVLDGEIAGVGVRISLPETSTQIVVDPVEIQQVIINLLQNSLYWLRQVDKNQREIVVAVSQQGLDDVEVLFSDSGPGVEPRYWERIFDPYFSTKSDGIGLGLAIAGDIISEYYAGSLMLLERGPLPGATFRFTLHRRV
jgi:signal transduction histidine kinase